MTKVVATALTQPNVSHPFLHFLLVGVDDYSAHRPDGGADLAGSLRDLSLWREVATRMGARDVTTLTSPLGGPLQATRTAILGAFDALVTELKRGEPPTQGVFVFAGHGADHGGPALCPSDLNPAFMNAVRLQELFDLATGLPTGASLTIVLDCCHSAVDPAGEDELVRPRGLGPAGVPVRRMGPPPNGVTVVGAGRRAYEHHGPGGWVGSFSLAATHTLLRWTPYGVVNDAGADVDGVFFDVSYGEWLGRTKGVLDALDLTCAPEVFGPDASCAVFQSPTTGLQRPVSVMATNNRHDIQIDPNASGLGFQRYNIVKNPVGAVLGTIFATAASPPVGWSANSEYWDVDPAALTGNVTFTAVTGAPPRIATRPQAWRVATTGNPTNYVVNAVVPPGLVVSGAPFRAFGVAAPGTPTARTIWLRAVVNNVGPSDWTAVPGGTTVSCHRTIEPHQPYTS